MKLSTLVKFKEELKEIQAKGLKISEYCAVYNKNNSYFSNKIRLVKDSLNVYTSEAEEVISLYNSLLKRTSNKTEPSSLNGVTPNSIDDGRATITINRDSDNLVESYYVEVAVRDSKPFTAKLSREETETLFGLYTYYGGNITARNVANEFPRFTLPEVKKLFRAFKLTKDSAWFPPHLLEELSTEELSIYRMNIKERAAFKYADSRKERDYDKKLKDLVSEINKLKNRNQVLADLQLERFDRKLVLPHLNKKGNEQSLIIWLSDMHVGAYNSSEGYIQLPEYNKQDINDRLSKIIATLSGNKYSRIFVVNLGDSLDNYNKETARGGHILPTVMTNKEQAHTYIEVMMSFFNSLKEEFDSEIYYYCIGDSNHGSDWEWAVNNILAEKLTAININCYISNNKIDQFEVDGNVFLYLHGDDSGDMKSGFPAVLNPKTENWFNSYIIENKIVADKDIYVVKGHSHVYAVNMAKSFIYMSAASLYGASNWMTANFGKTPWGVNFSEVKNGTVITGLINN